MKVNDAALEAMHQTLYEAEVKFRKSCAQITLLNARLEEMKLRYKKAKQENYNRFRYNLRLKLSVVEGARNMYYEYAYRQAEQVADIRRQLFGEVLQIFDDGENIDETEVF